jgi:hypothetical protein
MKWIGQHIYDLVARFRNDVYLEDISTGTIASGGNLGLDSNNKIVKATIASGSGDITEVNITTDSGSGSKASETSGSADFSILGSNGVGVTNSGSTITAVAVPAEIDHDSLNNFDANEHFTQANITTVGTISTGVWQGTAIASAYLDADTAHYSAQKQFTYHGFTIDMDTTKQYVGLLDADSENTNTTNGDLPIVAPVAGKLLKVFLRVNKNQTGLNLTFRLETQATGVTFGTGPTVVGTQSGAGPSTSSMVTYDFTSSLDSGDNIIDAGDTVYLSVQSDGATSNTKYYITCLWEWDLSSV